MYTTQFFEKFEKSKQLFSQHNLLSGEIKCWNWLSKMMHDLESPSQEKKSRRTRDGSLWTGCLRTSKETGSSPVYTRFAPLADLFSRFFPTAKPVHRLTRRRPRPCDLGPSNSHIIDIRFIMSFIRAGYKKPQLTRFQRLQSSDGRAAHRYHEGLMGSIPFVAFNRWSYTLTSIPKALALH